MIRRSKPLRRSTKPLKRARITGLPKHPAKRARKAAEARAVKTVRPQVEQRDGPCRVMRGAAGIVRVRREQMFGMCRGDSQWAHLSAYRRSKTVGKPAEERHSTKGSLMLCDRHHDDYDEHKLDIEHSEALAADGPMTFIKGSNAYIEQGE